jgi:hypothetical protein
MLLTFQPGVHKHKKLQVLTDNLIESKWKRHICVQDGSLKKQRTAIIPEETANAHLQLIAIFKW